MEFPGISRQSDPCFARALDAFSQACAVAALWVGVLVLGGWVAGLPGLYRPVAGAPAMVPLMALSLVCLGASLLLLQPQAASARRRLAGRLLAGLVLAMGLVLVAEYLFHLSTGLERLLFSARLPSVEPVLPGRPSPQSCLSMVFASLALLLLDAPPRRRYVPAELLTLLAFTLPYLALMGYAYGYLYLYGYLPGVGMAIHSALTMMLLSLGILAARPNRGWMLAFCGATPGGLMLRRLVPGLLLALPVLGWLRLMAERSHLVSDTEGILVMVLLMLVIMLAFTLWNVHTLDCLEEERQRSGKALQDSEALFRGLLETAPDAIVIVDRQGDVVQVNKQAEKLFGYERRELEGQPVEMLMPRRFREVHTRHRGNFYAYPHRRAMGMGLDLFALRRDGSEFPVEISLSPMETPEGTLVSAAIRDITERKRTLEEIAARTAELNSARELNVLKDHFLSTISHEMKTPLSLIMGYTELLEDTADVDETLLEGIREGSRRLNEHVENMLDYSALLSGSLPLHKTDVDLQEVVERVRGLLQESFELHDLKFRVEIDPATPVIRADFRRVTQILMELLENAEKYTPDGNALGVRICPADSQVRLDVWDTGPGISEAHFSRVWEAFSQLQVGDALRTGGLGLGLTIVRRLTELHGGKVGLVSQQGHGATFSIYLPIGVPAAPPSARAEGGQARERPE